jgi:DNA-binding CsgD family transcriptional regulator
MLLGRRAERVEIEALLGAARDRRSGCLLITGDPGIGKSTLLAYAEKQAEGMTVLSARGYESESEIPFAGLSDLFYSQLHLLDALPAPQAAALRSALSLGPPVPGDRFSVCAATVSMLAAAAEDAPLLVLVDDVHWLDASSREAILFAARRLHAEGIAVLLGSRVDAPSGDVAGVRQLRLQPLDPDDAAPLLGRLVPKASVDLRRKIYEAAAGNPLAIRELCDEWQRNSEPLPPSGVPPESRLAAALGGRLADLPGATHRALMLVAASPGAETDLVLRAAQATGLDLADFAPAETARLVVIEDRRVVFAHPLFRSILYGSATAHARASAHAALADALADTPGDAAADARAWHLAAARIPPDEETTTLLTEAGNRARRRGGHGEAARAFEAAARFSTPDVRPVLLRRAARGWELAGRSDRVLPLLKEALPLAAEPHLRAMIRHMDAYARMWRGRPADGLQRMVSAAQDVEDVDPERAALMNADSAIACFMLGRIDFGMRLLERAYHLTHRRPGAGASVRLAASVGLAIGLTTQARRAEAKRLLADCAAQLDRCDPLEQAQELAHAAFACVWLEEYAQAARWLQRVITEARRLGALGILPQTLGMHAELCFRTGRWSESRAAALESVTLAAETRQADAYSRYFVARLDGLQGREEECRAGVEYVTRTASRFDADGLPPFTGHLRGRLALTRGDSDEAIRLLEEVSRMPMMTQTRDQCVIPWAYDLIEAYARAHRSDEARALLTDVAPRPDDPDHRWAHAATARCRGLLAPRHEMNHEFESALELHERDGQPFERARTQLCFGERLRRDRRRGQARQQLRQALETFRLLHAVGWIQRAEAELAATGETLDRGTGVAALLTPQELQVATVVAHGASNSEAAAALFLSPKTIEYHLSNVYRKTQLRSRHDLSTLLSAAT